MMQPHDDHLLHESINAELAAIAGASSPPPSWHQAWSQLEPQFSDEERLTAYRAVRAADALPTERGFFLIAWMLNIVTDKRTDARLYEAKEHLEIVRQKYGLDEDVFLEFDEAPAEFREAMQQISDAWDTLYVATLEEHGEHEMARLFQNDPAKFEQQYEAGRQFFHGMPSDAALEDDEWLDCLLEEVGACLEADSPMGPLGLRSHLEEGLWEVSIYPTPVELVGGRHDGELVDPGFTLHLEELRACFQSVADFRWNALGLN